MNLSYLPLIISGESPEAIKTTAEQLQNDIKTMSCEQLQEFCYRRLTMAHADHRGAIIAADKEEMAKNLAALVQGRPARNVIIGTVETAGKPVLVFSGQGLLWPGMTTELFATSACFRRQINHYGEAFFSRLDWNPAVAISAGEEFPLAKTFLPVQFMLASALADLWHTFGLKKAAVVGHSIGEVAAARSCGFLNCEEAVSLISLWGEALTRIEGKGAMASVAAPPEQVAELLDKWQGQLEIAAINSARNVAVSGDKRAVEELLADLEKKDLWAWKVPGTSVAGHTRQVDMLKEMLLDQAPQASSKSGHAAFYSTVTGSPLNIADITPEYWFRTLRQTVLFEKSMHSLIEDGHRLFIEISAQPILMTVIEEILRSTGVKGAVIPTLDRRKGDKKSFIHALIQAFVHGVSIEWNSVYQEFFPQFQADEAPTSQNQSTIASDVDDRTVSPATDPMGDAVDHADLLRHPPSEQRRILLDLVALETKALLGHAFSDKTQPFKNIGLTSLTVVELSKALSAATGLDLPTTLLYDYSTPLALVEHLRRELGLESSDDEPAIRSGGDARVNIEEAIAIIGMACRYPGRVASPEDLWNLVFEGNDGIVDYPPDRGWDTANLYDPEPGRLGKIATRTGGFLYDAGLFDAGFFGISPREASTMEPQQRLLLEVSWEAIERAGIDPAILRGSNTGVFVGVMEMEYGSRMQQAPEEVAGLAYLGTSGAVASGRISYTFGLEGPTLTIDTACSSSLVAIHTACEAIRRNGCDLALAGGATVMSTPGILVDFSVQRVLAPDGRCKAFSASADGVGLGEGVGMVLLERLSEAQANGHPILGVIRGSAVNHDGASNGLTAPNGTSQQRLIRHALANAGLSLQDIDVVEAHGTGTRLGDPIEANALLATYGKQRPADHPLLLGSFKSNIGHSQAAAGVGGLIKILMAFRHGILPQSLHIEAPSPEVDWSAGTVQLLTEQQPWPDIGNRPRRAAISSFGVSGTNCHLIVEQRPAVPSCSKACDAGAKKTIPVELVWPLSSKTETALQTQAARLREHVISRADLDLLDVGYSLGITRSSFPLRAAVSGNSRGDLLKGLQAFMEGTEHPSLVRGSLPSGGTPWLVFVFPGQGAQWPGMGMALYDAYSVYRHALDQADEALRPFTGWSVIDVLRGKPGAPALEKSDVIQPAMFAVMVSIARLWLSFGLTPDAVMGHSQGEIAAAHIAGALSLQDAAKIVALRSQLLLTQSGTGTMAMIALSEEKTRALVERHGTDITLAVFNSPSATVVSGATDTISEFLKRCKSERIRTVRIEVDVPGHSPQLDALRPDLLDQFDGLSPQPTKIAFYSTVDGYPRATPLDGTKLGAEYWCDNLCRPVRFADCVLSQTEANRVTFLECSPHSVLLPAIEETMTDNGTAIGSMQSNKPLTECIRNAAARLYVNGHNPNWRALYPAAGFVDIPTYPFEHKHYWLTPQVSNDVATTGQRTTEHALLSAAIDLPDEEGLLLTGCISLASHPWLADHAAARVVLVPGTAYLDMVMHAGSLLGHSHIDELTLHAPMVLPEQGALDLQLRVGPPDNKGYRPVTLHARNHNADELDGSTWTLHATAQLAQDKLLPADSVVDLSPWPPVDAESIDIADMRARLTKAGYDYGPAFKGLRSAWRRGEDIYVEAHLPDDLVASGHSIHPALLDTTLHPIALADTEGDENASGLRLPFTFTGITCADASPGQLRAQLRFTKSDTVSIVATDETGTPILSIEALNLRSISSDHLRRMVGVGPDHDLLNLTWSLLPAAMMGTKDKAPPTAMWALLDTNSAYTRALDTIACYPGLSEMLAATEASSASTPEVILWPLPPLEVTDAEDVPGGTRKACEAVLQVLQTWLSHDQLARTVLVPITHRAVATGSSETAHLVYGPVWGLLRSAQSEHPDRLVLVDTDHTFNSPALLTTVLASGRSQVAVRDGKLYIPHLTRAPMAETLASPPDASMWRLNLSSGGGFDDLSLKPDPEAAPPLSAGKIRIDVHAAGINFYDVVCALGLIEQEHVFGAEAAGVVSEVGSGVEGFAVGDRVMALTEGAFCPTVIADQKMATHIPEGWSFAQAASVPVVFVTAYHALVDLAHLQPGEKILIHAAAGGVGQAAIQLAQHLGAEPFVTAHPNKWHVLRDLGIPEDHIASSRTLDYVERFRSVIGTQGIDVVLNSLAGSFIDASMELMAPGGRFIELGKTDIRDERQMTETYPHITYTYLSRPDLDHGHTAKMLAELVRLFRTDKLRHVPVTAFGIRNAGEAFRLMQQGRHTGKIVLTIPQAMDTAGTALITGGTGTLGGLLARHLVLAHGVRHLVLASRSGPDAADAPRLRADLEDLGAAVTIVACDTADRGALKQVLDAIPSEHPLTAVIHTAGVLSDATIANLTPEDFAKVFAAKVFAAWHLHDLTRHLDLAAFVLYSSSAGIFGNPGQGNYAAANTFLDNLAQHRRRNGLPATSLAWGWWQIVTGMSRRLTDTDNARIARSGLAPFAAEHGHAMLDAALSLPFPVLAAVPLNQQTLRKNSQLGTLHPLLERLTTSTASRRAKAAMGSAADLRKELAVLEPAARANRLRTLIVSNAGVVLGLDDTAQIPLDQSFKSAGLDSLMALELRNRLTGATGLRLAATVTYDFPTPDELAAYLGEQLFPEGEGEQPTTDDEAKIRVAIESIPLASLREFGLLDTLLKLAGLETEAAGSSEDNNENDIRSASVDELVERAMSGSETKTE